MSTTLPQLCCATYLAPGSLIASVRYANGETLEVVAQETGDNHFYNHLHYNEPDNLLTNFASWLNLSLIGSGITGAWSIEQDVDKPEHARLTFSGSARAHYIDFLHPDLPPLFLGFYGATNARVNDGGPSIGNTSVFKMGWPGGLWRPDMPPVSDLRKGRASVGVSEDVGGNGAVVLVFGKKEIITLEFEFILGCFVWKHYVNDAFAAAVEEVEATDKNMALEALWDWHLTHGPLRYYPDRDVSDFVEVEINDQDVLQDLSAALEDGGGTPVFYRVALIVKHRFI